MAYSAYDSRGYLGDVATIAGWSKFCEWADTQAGPVRDLAERGACEDVAGLHAQLAHAMIANDADTDAIRANLADIAARAKQLLIVSDGA